MMKKQEKKTVGVGYQPKTGARCGCREGVQRNNCPACEGTGWRIDFSATRNQGPCEDSGPCEDRGTCQCDQHY